MNYNRDTLVWWDQVKSVTTPYTRYFYHPLYNFIGLTFFYFVMVALLPANHAVLIQYHLSTQEYRILLFVVELPLVFVWFSAFYGYHRLREYANSIKNTKEAEIYSLLATGCHWLAWGFVIPSIISLFTSTIASGHPGFHPTSIIISNYLNLLFPLVAFSIIGDAAQKLTVHHRAKSAPWSNRGLLLAFVMIGTFYCYLTFRFLNLQHLSSTNNPYYLPVWLLILTITIPYLYAWLIGLLAAYQFGLFAKQVKGIIYRRALQLVAVGVVLVIIDSIGVQYLHSVVPRTGHLSLNAILIATYAIYFVIIAGFVLISLGASRLKKIEDI